MVTEVMATEDVALVARYADVLQIGARKHAELPPARGKRQMRQAGALETRPSATMEELLLAAEYILDAGNPNVMLCERGIPHFRDATRGSRCRWHR